MKRIIAAAAAILLAAGCLTSCQLAEMIDKGEQTTTTADNAETTTPAPAETTPAVKYDPVDFNEVDVLQYVTPAQYKGVAVTVTYEKLTDDQYAKAVDTLLTESSYYTQITDRAAATGDTLNINYKGFMDGEQFSGGTADGQTISLTENSGFIDGFADGLVGVNPGETVTLDLTFPENYYEDLAGKAVKFEVKVNYIQGDLITPLLDDAFVAKYTDGECTTVAAFEQYYRGVLQDELDEVAKSEAISTLWKGIVDETVVKEYPEQHVMYFYGQLIDQYEYYASYYSVDLATVMSLYGVTEESLMEAARTYAKEDMAFFAIAKLENISISDAEYTEGLANIAASAGTDSATLENYYGKEYIVESLLWDKVIAQIYDWAVVTEG